ncbi:MAG: L,D-transpeptidase [Dehalococcoidia bacterium]
MVRRVANETMTSASLNITDPDDQYVLKDVLYTQYFTWVGHALHLNYWQPDSVFGAERTSHGCVGLRLADAEFRWPRARVARGSPRVAGRGMGVRS